MKNLKKLLDYFPSFKRLLEARKNNSISLEEAKKIRSTPIKPTKAETNFDYIPSQNFQYTVLGKEFHSAEILLEPQGSLNARAGSLVYMDNSIDSSTVLHGGISDSIGRSISGGSTFLINYTNNSEINKATIMLSPMYPSKIIPYDLEKSGGMLYCHSDSYLCGDAQIKVSAKYISNPVAGVWSGEGFTLQKLEGSGVVLLCGGGVIMKKTIGLGEELRLSPGNILAFDPRIEYKMLAVKGIKNIIFGQGFFFVVLKGPGDVYVQTMTAGKIASNLISTLKRLNPMKYFKTK